MLLLRRLTLAAALTLVITGAARAQDLGPRLIGGGEDAEVVYAAPSRNVAGGGFASIAGGDENRQITYGPRVATLASSGLVAELAGGGENAQVVYHQASPSETLIAGRLRRPSD